MERESYEERRGFSSASQHFTFSHSPIFLLPPLLFCLSLFLDSYLIHHLTMAPQTAAAADQPVDMKRVRL